MTKNIMAQTKSRKRKVNKDTQRLETLIDVISSGNSNSDFEESLFFARRKTKTEMAAYRRALDDYYKTHSY